ncbi:ATP-binding protein [bacterium]|nr:ATP-binding protein [bacterium]NUN47156.1 response regulator [bacterium]
MKNLKKTFLLFLLVRFGLVSGQTIAPKITVYHPGTHPQNWQIVQAPSGILYLSNGNAFYSYDGVTWRYEFEISGGPIRATEFDAQGKLYYDGPNDLGYIEFTNGKPRRVSLLDKLPSGAIAGGVRSVAVIDSAVYFVCRSGIYRWKNQTFTTIAAGKKSFGVLYYNGGKITITGRDEQKQYAIFELAGDSIVEAPFSKYSKKDGTYGVFRFDSNRALIGSHEKGLILWDKGDIRPIYPLKYIHSGIRLKHGGFAFCSFTSGLVILNDQLQVVDEITEKEGLSANACNGVLEDQEGNLWVMTEDGVNKIELSSFRFLQKEQGLKSGVNCIFRKGDNLFIGTGNDLYELHKNHTQAFGIGAVYWSVPIGEIHLLGTVNGLKIFDASNKVTTWDAEVNAYSYCELENGRWLLGKNNGLCIIDIKSKQIKNVVPALKGRIFQIFKGTPGKFWIRSGANEIINMDLNSETIVSVGQNLSSENKNLEIIGGGASAWIACRAGIFSYDTVQSSFVRDTRLWNESEPITYAITDMLGDIWVSTPTKLFRGKQVAATMQWDSQTFSRIALLAKRSALNYVLRDRDSVIWFSTTSGVIRYDQKLKHVFPSHSTVISFFGIGRDSVLFQGNAIPDNLTLGYDQTQVRIEYGSTSFVDEKETEFQYKLSTDKGWSIWSKENTKEYSNLYEGTYVFSVRSRNVLGHVSQDSHVRFTVLPPWYRTWWAYLLYVTLLGLTWWGGVQFRSRKILAEKAELERIVEVRTRQLQEQAKKLEEMDEIKSRFFANISHEFRTPLTLILGPLEELRSGPSAWPMADMVLRNGKRLLRLVNQLLDISKIENHQLKPNACLGDLNFMKGVVHAFSSLADRKGIELKLKLEDNLPEFYRDREFLEKILFNLISNAIKFTQKGEVRVSVQRDSDHIQINVSDTGVGISESDITKIFDRFYQVDSSEMREYPGTGIGLALAKQLSELHHGRLTVVSQLHRGTTFTLHLPLNPEVWPDEEKSIEADRTVKWDAEADWSDDNVVSDTNSEYRGKTILIVEDHPDVRDYIKEHLSGEFQISEARDGVEGFDKAVSLVPDLIISDIMMPKKDGVALSRELKKDMRTNHIPVILLTAKASEDNKIEGLETGADDYLVKPFNVRELKTRINNCIRLRETLIEKYSKTFFSGQAIYDVKNVNDLFMSRVQEVLEENITDPDFNVEDMAAQLLMSRSQLYRKMIALTGMNPTDTIRKWRLKKAKIMLEKNAGNVSQVAFDVGFNNLSYFTKCFREEFGKNPSEF